MEELGIEENPRGAGVCFGPDVAQTFMENNHLSMLIRSHECVRTGFCLHYVNDFETNICPPGIPLVCSPYPHSNPNSTTQSQPNPNSTLFQPKLTLSNPHFNPSRSFIILGMHYFFCFQLLQWRQLRCLYHHSST